MNSSLGSKKIFASVISSHSKIVKLGFYTEENRINNLRFHSYHFVPYFQTSLSFQIQDENSINDSDASLMIGGQSARVYQ